MPAQRRNSGAVHLIPIIIVALVVFVALSLTSKKEKGEFVQSGKSVLSETDEPPVDNEEDVNDDQEEDEDQESGVEVETRTDGVRITTRDEDGRTRTDIYRNGERLRIEIREGVTRVKLENNEAEVENEIELEEGEEIEVREATEESRIRIGVSRNRFVVGRDNFEARTSFPVSVDLATNELVITTPAGEKRVTILPDQAVNNMLAANVIQRVVELPDEPGEEAVEITTLPNGRVVYEVEGTANERLLGLIDVFVPRTAVVDAQTGQLLTTRQSFVSLILDLLSF